jgi:glycosyltransferase involved in cell wall biosynthesis
VKASIVICTRDRCARLKTLLSSVADADAGAMTLDLLVVDDGSRDATAEIVASFAKAAEFPVVLLQQPRRGLAVARNRGLRAARGELIIFLDDDCVISRDYFKEAAARFAGEDAPVLRGGRVELGDPADAPVTIRTSPEVTRLSAYGDPGGFILGCNMAVTRAAAHLIGPFDERFGPGALLRSAEDTDYVLRALLAGVTVEYVPDMTVYHHHGRRSSEAISRVHRDYEIGNGGLTMKHALHAPWLWRPRYWTARNAIREMFGGPQFDPVLHLSHGPIVAHNAIGACLFAYSKIRKVAPWSDAVGSELMAAPAGVV